MCRCSEALLGDNARLLGVKCLHELRPLSAPVDEPRSILLHKLSEESYSSLYFSRGVSQSALKRIACGLEVQFVGDSEILTNCLLGRATTKDEVIFRQVQLAHTALRTLVQCFSIVPLDGAELAQQVPRSNNSAADAAANWALDHKSFMDVRVHEVQLFFNHCASQDVKNCGMLFSFDGASRGNPGLSSSGVCAWWGLWAHGTFQSRGLLLQRGTNLGNGSNNSAEAHGLASCFKTALRFLFWVTGHLAQLAQHSVRHEGLNSS